MALLRGFVEGNLYIVAGIALGVAVAQLLGNACSKSKSPWFIKVVAKYCSMITLSSSNYIFINYFSDMVGKKIRRPNRRSKVTLAPS